MSLYQKHRPKTLADIKGNKTMITTLGNMFSGKVELPHVFLLHGPTGTGKTTTARIIAKELGCNFHNIKEIDVAQFTGIDTARAVRKEAQLTPLGGGNKMYIIDEAHNMSSQAQDGFLKVFEDTPPRAFFVLCTTEFKKLKPTLRGRCSIFQLELLKDVEMADLLAEVTEAEGDEIDNDVIEAIVKSADGHPRNALTILQQVLATPARRRLKIAETINIVETSGFELAQALLQGKPWNTVKTLLQGLQDQDPEGVRRVVLGFMKSVLLKGKNDQAALVMEYFIEPFYNSLFPGLVFACYQVIEGKD